MKIYRFVPDLNRYAHPWRSLAGRWWPEGIELGKWMDYACGGWGRHPPDGRYIAYPEEFPLSDFPWLSLQVPVMSERAAEQLGCHPDRNPDWRELAGRLRPIRLNDQAFFAVQPLLGIRGEPNAFVPEASIGIRMPRGEVLHYHTRTFEPARLRGELFTIPEHEPYAETYVTGAFVERARNAGLTGIDHLELVFDDAPIAPSYPAPPAAVFADPSFRHKEEWDLFYERGSMGSYFKEELEEAFRGAVLAGLLPVEQT